MAFYRCGTGGSGGKGIHIKVTCNPIYQGYNIICTIGSIIKTKICGSTNIVDFYFSEIEVSTLPATFNISNTLNDMTVNITTSIYGWHETTLSVWNGELYENGNEFISLTGGWQQVNINTLKSVFGVANDMTQGFATKGTNNMAYGDNSASYYQASGFITANQINFSGKTYLKANITYSGDQGAGDQIAYLGLDRNTKVYGRSGTLTLNISGKSPSKIAIYSTCGGVIVATNNIIVNKIWLE